MISTTLLDPMERSRISKSSTRGVTSTASLSSLTWEMLKKPIESIEIIKYLNPISRL